MRYLNNIFVVLLFLGMSVTSIHAQSNVYVKEKAGTQTTFPLINLQRISFTNGNVTIEKTDKSKAVFLISNLRYLSFTEYTDNPTNPDPDPNPVVDPPIPTSVLHTSKTETRVFPNPVKEILFIQSNDVVTVDILNAVGEIILSQSITKDSSIDVSGLSQGIYICRIQQGSNQSFSRFIKE